MLEKSGRRAGGSAAGGRRAAEGGRDRALNRHPKKPLLQRRLWRAWALRWRRKLLRRWALRWTRGRRRAGGGRRAGSLRSSALLGLPGTAPHSSALHGTPPQHSKLSVFLCTPRIPSALHSTPPQPSKPAAFLGTPGRRPPGPGAREPPSQISSSSLRFRTFSGGAWGGFRRVFGGSWMSPEAPGGYRSRPRSDAPKKPGRLVFVVGTPVVGGHTSGFVWALQWLWGARLRICMGTPQDLRYTYIQSRRSLRSLPSLLWPSVSSAASARLAQVFSPLQTHRAVRVKLVQRSPKIWAESWPRFLRRSFS